MLHMGSPLLLELSLESTQLNSGKKESEILLSDWDMLMQRSLDALLANNLIAINPFLQIKKMIPNAIITTVNQL